MPNQNQKTNTPMQAKKELWERARRDGADRRVNELLSAAYLLVSEAYVLYSEAESELRRYGLLLGQTKHLLGAVERTMNRYFDQFKGAVKPQERANYFEDLDALDKAYRRWAKLGDDNGDHPADAGKMADNEKGGAL